MAAATVVPAKTLFGGPRDVVTELQVSAMTSGQTEVLSHGGPSGARPYKTEIDVITAPNSGPITHVWLQSSDDTSANTSSVKFNVPAAGDITNGVVLIRFYFKDAKSGGLVTA